MLTRRDLLWLAGAGAAASMTPRRETAALRRMGMTPAGFPFRTRVPGFDIVDYSHALGAGAVQTRMPDPNPDAVRAFRRKLEGYEMRAILGVRLPAGERDVPAFEAAIKTARDVDAVCVHAAMTGRRYEDFDTLADFKASFARNRRAVELAEPVLRAHRMKLAIENHKGWRSAEQAAWLRGMNSEYIGVCFDFGNNISLCEDPMETLDALAPITFYCHLKDMGVEMYDDGFLLSEVPLGEGLLDIPRMVNVLQAKNPDVILGLEMITRDPLTIPVFTDKYWVTFSDAASPLPGYDLARTLRLVRAHPPAKPLPRTTGLSFEAQLRLEDECIARSIAYARQHLSL